MSQTNHPIHRPDFHSLQTIFFWLAGVESLIAALSVISLPSESNAFLGLSPARLAILLVILFPGCACFLLAILQSIHRFKRLGSQYSISQPSLIFFSCLSLAGIFLTTIALLQDIYSSTNIYIYLAYAQRLTPLLVYFALLAVQAALIIALVYQGKIREFFAAEKPFLTIWGLVFGGLVLLVIGIAVTRFGLTPDPIGWGKPTVPLLEWQIWLGVLLSLLFRLSGNSPLSRRIIEWKNNHPVRAGWVFSLLIWALAMSVWASQPVPPGFFATPPRAPNYEIYPFSDAAFYDFHAQSLLIGLGYRGESIPPRPLYILFLAAAHLIAGQEYTRVILLQTALLAFFPVIIFWIGKRLLTSSVGFIAALFVILREWTSIVSTPFTSDVSNSKLMFADLPAAMAVSLVLLVSILWLQKPRKIVLSLLTGGILGISLLIRTQIIILLPVILIFYGLVSIRKRLIVKSLIIPSLLFLIGFILAVAPWLSRSYRITGQFVFDHPESQTRVIVQRYYSSEELTDFDRKPGESTGEYNQRLSEAIRQRIFSNPGSIIQFTAAHWLNSEIANLQIFPIRFSITSLSELIKPEHAFWEEWNGQAAPRQMTLMLINLAVLAAGLVFVVRKNTWIGLLPMVFNLAYHFSNAAARNSGWRYLLPADWIFLFYFAAGIAAIINFGNVSNSPCEKISGLDSGERSGYSITGLTAIAAGILFIGFLPVISESVFPRVYPTATIQNTRQIFLDSSSNLSAESQNGLKKLMADPNAVVMHGRMLYPRFYGEKEGEEKTGKTGYAPLPYARYVFLVAGDPEGTVIFPQVQPDLPLRNAHDVLLIGCMDGLAVKANLLILPDANSAVYTADTANAWVCTPQP